MSLEESNKTSKEIPSQDSLSNPRPEEEIAEMMRAIVDAEDINYDDMAGG